MIVPVLPWHLLNQIVFCALYHIPTIVKKFQDHWEALEEENAGARCSMAVTHQVVRWEMKVDRDEGSNLEFYL